MGSFARVRVISARLDQALTGRSIPVLGCDLEGSDVHLLSPMKHAVIVIGSEGRGLSAAVQPSISQRITIPRYGGAESLNAGGRCCHRLRQLSATPRPVKAGLSCHATVHARGNSTHK